ncbi:MAG: hypothetical protein METHSR3v1_2110011 [Methanothrix sp.]|nr:MAG: hypothetical protein METHSR3v1_2110011 [Methanothrix sp.]
MVAGGSEAPFLKVKIYTIYPNSKYNNCQEYHKFKGEAQRVECHLISSSLYLSLYRCVTTIICDQFTCELILK